MSSIFETDKKELPSTLNVLTILTFVGCGLGLIFSLASPKLLEFSRSMIEKAAQNTTDDLQLAKLEEARQTMDITQQNMIPLMGLGIAGIIACFIGALMMRKLKKDGYYIYVIGQIVPIVGTMVFLGSTYFSDWKNIIGLVIPVVFIVLYTLQKKHLV
jgi:hypothetical protein